MLSLPSLPALSTRSVQTRIPALFVLLIVVLQVGVFALLNTLGAASVRTTIGAEVVAGARVFDRVLELDTQRTIEGMRVLTADPAFREIVVAGDRNALAPVLAKQAKRSNAAVMLLVNVDHRVVAGTPESEIGRRITYPKLLDRAAAAQQAVGIVPLGGQLYQLAVVPVPAPHPVAWVVTGFRINDGFAQELRNLTRLEVSLLARHGEGEWRLHASTLPDADRAALSRDIAANRYSAIDSEGNSEFGDDAISRVVNLAPRADEGVVAVLQRPLSSALEPLRQLQLQLAWLSLLGIAAAIVAGLALGRGIAGPVRDVATAARRVAAGDYSVVAPVSRKDEIGELVTAFRAMQEAVAACVSRMTDLAHKDALTGLPTRVLLVDRLEQALAGAARAGSPVAVLILSLDHFADINDTLGRPIGDLLLREVAARLRSVVRRATDSVARIGGDEFAIVMPGGRVADAQRVAASLVRALEVKMTLNGHIVDVSTSIGIAACPDHGSDPGKLMERADAAMHAAKRDQAGVALWDERYDEHGEQRLSLLADLRKAVDNDELALTYQPKIALGEGGEHFVEALVRWQHPTRGLVPPSEFVPLAEQTGYIRTVSQWVLGRAIAQCAEWRTRGLSMNVSVNISARDLFDSELPAWLTEVLEREGCSAQWLTLEIAERAIVNEPGHALKSLERLHGLGCRLAIDDYGTGNSSVAHLRRLPLDELKIDKSCVAGMAVNASDALVVRTTIELAHELGFAVAATGVENEMTLEQLRELRCDSVQGFLLSRPLPADDVPSWVKESVWSRQARERESLRRVV
jgi:diguanylate cyclase (GGDEF)-like protein